MQNVFRLYDWTIKLLLLLLLYNSNVDEVVLNCQYDIILFLQGEVHLLKTITIIS